MPLNKVKGNMYNFVTHTWNTVRGECPHGCHYCYMKRFGEQPPVRFVEQELKTDLGSGNFIFVGSSCDLFADAIPHEWISPTISHCRKYPDNRYLFQSKNTRHIFQYAPILPPNTIIGTTIESNRYHPQMGAAPKIWERAAGMRKLRKDGIDMMITIEPIMDFNTGLLEDIIKACRPRWVNIGANTRQKACPLTEPSPEKVQELIDRLKEFTEVKVKSNLKRLLPNQNRRP